jgi:hypothetical protein
LFLGKFVILQKDIFYDDIHHHYNQQEKPQQQQQQRQPTNGDQEPLGHRQCAKLETLMEIDPGLRCTSKKTPLPAVF